VLEEEQFRHPLPAQRMELRDDTGVDGELGPQRLFGLVVEPLQLEPLRQLGPGRLAWIEAFVAPPPPKEHVDKVHPRGGPRGWERPS